MAYTKITWVNGETPINADNLNHIETGIKDNDTTLSNIKGAILWTNPDPTVAFSTQTITLNSSDYDVLEIFYYNWVDIDSYKDLLCQKTIKGYSTELQSQFTHNSNAYAGYRRIRYIDDTKLQVDNGYRVIDNSSFNTGEANYWNVPVYVIGYKTGLFGGQS